MTEDLKTPEVPQITREEVVEAFKPFLQRGISNPDDLPRNDPEFTTAHDLHETWILQQKEKARKSGTLAAQLEYALSSSTVFIDAGFSDPDYLDEVANDWLAQDLQSAEDAGLIDISSRIKAKIEEIEAKIA